MTGEELDPEHLDTEGTTDYPLGDPSADSRQVGPYRLLQKVGEGGMGEVWEAEQLEPVRRRVAVKVIKRGMDTQQVVARFEAERQALAMMNHPNVARVFDAGETPRGRPYFAMEFVKGDPITEYCDRNRLGTNQRLDLFTEVCEGVQHAHQKGIIHRDLKPSNILVSVEGGHRAVPKIIDFGVAKATDHSLTQSTLFTELGQLIGTPEYMSPEQAEMTGVDIDTRADVYSLGVVLYQLLTGALPFERRELRQHGLEEIRRYIREEEPAKPSTRVSSLGEMSAEVASQRQTQPATLARRLRGDLDWIVMKALEKDRTRRYGSPSDLAADIRRQQTDQPVEASPPSRLYRLRKFVKRHRVGVATTTVVALAVVLGGIGMTVGFVQAEIERETAVQERDKAQAVLNFLQNILAAPSPESSGRDVRVIDVLRTADERAAEYVSGTPEVEATVRNTLGQTYIGLGHYPEAKQQFEKALSLFRQAYGDEHRETANAMSNLAATHYYLGDYASATEMGREAWETKARVYGENHEETLTSLTNLASIAGVQGDKEEQERLQRELVERSLEHLGEEHRVTNTALQNLASTLDELGKLEEAEELTRKALAIRERVFGPEHPSTLYTAHNLALLVDQKGQPAEAAELHRENHHTMVRVLGEDHPETLNSMNGLALATCKSGEYEEAQRLYEELLALAEPKLGELHPRVLIWHRHYGWCIANGGEFERAEAMLLALVPRFEEANHPRVDRLYEAFAQLYDKWGRSEKAAEARAKVLVAKGGTGP